MYGAYLNDLILWLAERGLFRPLWSEEILEELEVNLMANGEEPAFVKKRLGAMRTHFPDAVVTGYASLVEAMSCHPKDRHVLAAAVRADAEVLVTFNLKDFPSECVATFDVEIVHPDVFLLDQLDLYPGPTVGVLHQLVRGCSRPELSIDDLLVALAGAGCPSSHGVCGPISEARPRPGPKSGPRQRTTTQPRSAWSAAARSSGVSHRP